MEEAEAVSRSPDGTRSPRSHEANTHISLDRVSGRLLDKDHNMTLFLLCPGSVNRRRASTAPVPFVLVIDHTSRLPFRWQKSTCPFLLSCHFEDRRFFTNDNPYAISRQGQLLVPPEGSSITTLYHSLFSILFLGGTILPNSSKQEILPGCGKQHI